MKILLSITTVVLLCMAFVWKVVNLKPPQKQTFHATIDTLPLKNFKFAYNHIDNKKWKPQSNEFLLFMYPYPNNHHKIDSIRALPFRQRLGSYIGIGSGIGWSPYYK